MAIVLYRFVLDLIWSRLFVFEMLAPWSSNARLPLILIEIKAKESIGIGKSITNIMKNKILWEFNSLKNTQFPPTFSLLKAEDDQDIYSLKLSECKKYCCLRLGLPTWDQLQLQLITIRNLLYLKWMLANYMGFDV